jgi:hypothetical protein
MASRQYQESSFKESRVQCCLFRPTLSAVQQVMLSSCLNTLNHECVNETLLDRLMTLQQAVNAYNKTAKHKINPATATYGDVNKAGSLDAEDEEGADEDSQAAAAAGGGRKGAAASRSSSKYETPENCIFQKAIYHGFIFAQVYGPDLLNPATKTLDTEPEPDDQLLEKGCAEAKKFTYTLKHADLLAMQQRHPALAALPSFAVFLFQRILHCRDITHARKSASNSVEPHESLYYKSSHDSAKVVQDAVAVYMVWVHTLCQSHANTLGKADHLPALPTHRRMCGWCIVLLLQWSWRN